MNYCSNCGQPVSLAIPEDDDRERHICRHCDTIHYQNPRIITGCLPIYDDGHEPRVLLCKRAIEPRYGKWTLPAGFMENGETAEQGAARECWEEARAKVSIGDLYNMTSIPNVNQVHLFFMATLDKPEFASGPESLEVELLKEADIPWDEISFTAVKVTLQNYFRDRANGQFPLRSGWAGPNEWGEWHWNKH
ncbi:NUDIX hydrolase [Porticoccus sp. W117]|uniref:NUDIX hydrolase n=1 Tax=Porticoccus sp. W117 TaxID=3054777 RepID=UPI0025961168|nr:NUDIX hydrolase [Porticoccus sp. W117]MDM3872163.1 NUDIX hydrolase [Porticoccus sp. W117]